MFFLKFRYLKTTKADYWIDAYTSVLNDFERWRKRAKEAERIRRKNYHLFPVKPSFDNPQ